MKKTIFLILVTTLMSLAGCKTKTVYVPVNSVKTEYKDRLQKDSVYLSDSVLIYKSGDTVYQTKSKYFFRNVYLKDTLLRVDSIRVPYPVMETKVQTKEVNKLTWYQKASCYYALISLILLTMYLGVKYRSKIISIFRKLVFKV